MAKKNLCKICKYNQEGVCLKQYTIVIKGRRKKIVYKIAKATECEHVQ